MSDDDLVIKLPSTPVKPNIPWTQVVSGAALVVSFLSAAFAGLQWWEAREARRNADRPYLEVMSAVFNEHRNLNIKYHNIGKTPAFAVKNEHDTYAGRYLGPSEDFLVIFLPIYKTIAFIPDVPVGKDGEVYVPFPPRAAVRDELKRRGIDHHELLSLQLRGRISYKDGFGNLYQTSYCYAVDEPTDAPPQYIPVPSTCISLEKR